MTKCGVFLDQIPHWKGGDESPVVGTVAKFSEVCGSEGEVGPLISRFVRCGMRLRLCLWELLWSF